MGEADELVRNRLLKLERVRSLGLDPYPHRFRRTHTTAEALASFRDLAPSHHPTPYLASLQEEGPLLSLAGRLVSARYMGKAIFCHLQDGSGRIQIYLRYDVLGEERYAFFRREFDLGDFLGVQGRLFRTRTGEVTLEVEDFVMLCKALRPLPEKWHGLTDVEKRYRERHLDLVANAEVRQLFALRSRVISAIRRFLDGHGFIEVEVPILQASAGGALARPFTTHHRALDRELYLRIATELHLKRLIIGGFDKVYEIGRIFRNEGISTKHNPEFTSLESYEAYADYQDVMAMLEEMVAQVAQEVLGTSRLSWDGEVIDFTPPWPRIPLREAIRQYAGIDFEDYPDAESLRSRLRSEPQSEGIADVTLGRGKLIDHLISAYVEPRLIQPTFLVDYPVEMSPLAKRKPGSSTLVERFEAFAGGMEFANAFTELNDPIEQRERFREQMQARLAGDEETEVMDEDFLRALEHGMPPTGGLGVGLDRLVMLLSGQHSIREVILFPQLRSKD